MFPWIQSRRPEDQEAFILKFQALSTDAEKIEIDHEDDGNRVEKDHSSLQFSFKEYRPSEMHLIRQAKLVRHYHKIYVHRGKDRPNATICGHTDRPNYAKGRCRRCYQNSQRKINLQFKKKIKVLESNVLVKDKKTR